MTEAEWLTATDPERIMDFLGRSASQRKLRLFACACCWQMIKQHGVDDGDESAVEVAARFADGNATLDELTEASTSTTSDWEAGFACADAASPDLESQFAVYAADNAAYSIASSRTIDITEVTDDRHPEFIIARRAAKALQSDFLRDIFGNPFRPVAFDPDWRTSTAVAIARIAYDSREFGDLPVLADALQDAGCDSEPLLDHLRGPGPHVRGCWAVDLVLGKS